MERRGWTNKRDPAGFYLVCWEFCVLREDTTIQLWRVGEGKRDVIPLLFLEGLKGGMKNQSGQGGNHEEATGEVHPRDEEGLNERRGLGKG